jgi:leucyl-tRNA synthetase
MTNKSITELARELRSNPTPSEKKMWELLRKRRLNGFRFIRQKPFIHTQFQNNRYFYIADFYCPEKKLVIEVDGKVHEYQKEFDRHRDIVLKERGLIVLRIKNEELRRPGQVKEKVSGFIASL